jgi:predicted NAD/FAD-dependent oxidoreductase
LHGAPALAALAAVGAQVHMNTKVSHLEARGAGWLVSTEDGEHQVDQVVLAVPPPAAHRLLPPGSVTLPEGWADQLGSSPIINAHIVYDRQVTHEPFVAGVGTPIQWVFDRTESAGLADGQYLAVSLSAADDLVDLPTAVLRERLLPAVTELLPAAGSAQVRDFFVTRERHATFRAAPGSAALRPPARTGHRGLFLAGAWTATGWPATMESAVLSGNAAADALLREQSHTVEEAVA